MTPFYLTRMPKTQGFSNNCIFLTNETMAQLDKLADTVNQSPDCIAEQAILYALRHVTVLGEVTP